MKKSIRLLSVLLCGCALFSGLAQAADTNAPKKAKKVDPTTRRDAVIFKVHDIAPVEEEGIVTGCDFSVTLYNRTSINFRNFTLNLAWNDKVAEKFKFNEYMEKFLSEEEFDQQKKFLGDEIAAQPLLAAITVNAFGADKQISIRSHVNSVKCYLMLSNASYSVTPCDIVRNIDAPNVGGNFDNKECTALFQFVDTSNPEYFGQFKKLPATDIALQAQVGRSQELTDIDDIIDKIVENLGVSDKALTNIN